MDERPRRRPNDPTRRRLRLSVRALMVVVLVLAVGLGWIVHRAQVQREAVAAIVRRVGLSITTSTRQAGRPAGGQPQVAAACPKWLVERLGVDFFGDVICGHARQEGHRRDMAHVGSAPSSRPWAFRLSDAITDAGVAHLAGLRRAGDGQSQRLEGHRGGPGEFPCHDEAQKAPSSTGECPSPTPTSPTWRA